MAHTRSVTPITERPGKRLAFFSLRLSCVDMQLEYMWRCIPSIYNYFFVFSSTLNVGMEYPPIYFLYCSSCSGLQHPLGERLGRVLPGKIASLSQGKEHYSLRQCTDTSKCCMYEYRTKPRGNSPFTAPQYKSFN